MSECNPKRIEIARGTATNLPVLAEPVWRFGVVESDYSIVQKLPKKEISLKITEKSHYLSQNRLLLLLIMVVFLGLCLVSIVLLLLNLN